MTAIRETQARMSSLARLVSALALVLPLLGNGQEPPDPPITLDSVHWDVRVIRYAALRDSLAIPGDDDTPANRQTWLDDIAAALEETTEFFWYAWHDPPDTEGLYLWHYTPITFDVQTDPETGKITVAAIAAEIKNNRANFLLRF